MSKAILFLSKFFNTLNYIMVKVKIISFRLSKRVHGKKFLQASP